MTASTEPTTEVVIEIVENVKVHLVDTATDKWHLIGMVTRYDDGQWRVKTHKAGTEQSGFPNRESATRVLLLLYENDLADAVKRAQKDQARGLALLAGVAR